MHSKNVVSPEVRAEAYRALSRISRSSLAKEGKAIIDAHLEAVEARRALQEAEDKLKRAEREYSSARRELAVESWKSRDLAWCSYKGHLASSDSITIVEVLELTRHSLHSEPLRYATKQSNVHRVCDTCRGNIASQGFISISFDGNVHAPDNRLLMFEVELREDGVYVKRDSRWEELALDDIPDKAPESFDHLLTEDDDIPPNVKVKSPRMYAQPELMVDTLIITAGVL